MKLKEFPLVLRVFHAIELDNGGTRARGLKPETEVPEHWLVPFQVVERVFQGIGEVKVGATLGWKVLKDREITCAQETDYVWEVIASGGDDEPEVLMNALGVNETDQWLVNQLLNQFFDGELSGVFTEEWRH